MSHTCLHVVHLMVVIDKSDKLFEISIVRSHGILEKRNLRENANSTAPILDSLASDCALEFQLKGGRFVGVTKRKSLDGPWFIKVRRKGEHR